jgi:hypothetical protein
MLSPDFHDFYCRGGSLLHADFHTETRWLSLFTPAEESLICILRAGPVAA